MRWMDEWMDDWVLCVMMRLKGIGRLVGEGSRLRPQRADGAEVQKIFNLT